MKFYLFSVVWFGVGLVAVGFDFGVRSGGGRGGRRWVVFRFLSGLRGWGGWRFGFFVVLSVQRKLHFKNLLVDCFKDEQFNFN